MMMRLGLAGGLLVAASSEKLQLTHSHTNHSDEGCVVAGFDPADRSKVFVGGPCAELKGAGAAAEPTANFRWLEMQTVYGHLVNQAGQPAPLKDAGIAAIGHEYENAQYAEVGLGTSMKFSAPELSSAHFYMSTTSYLAKDNFDFANNAFVVGKDNNGVALRMEQCVVPCCDDPASAPGGKCECAGQACPSKKLSATKGQYKYSIMAGAYDDGASAKGWSKVKETYGVQKTTGKVLENVFFEAFQVIDFTNMKADTLKITKPDASTIMYKDMISCNLVDSPDCPGGWVSTNKVKVESDNWVGEYDFPKIVNYGEFSSFSSVKPLYSKMVDISLAKPDVKTMVGFGIAGTEGEAAAKKVVTVKYRFDISGVENGGYMNYDPSIVTSKSDAAAAPAAPTPAPAAPTPAPAAPTPAPVLVSGSPSAIGSSALIISALVQHLAGNP